MATTRSKSKKSSSKKKRKASSSRNPPYIRMAFEAIMKTKHAGKGVSRAKIANYIKSNWDDLAEGAQFNSCLRRALKDGIERGVLEEGITNQRYKITDLGRKENKETSFSKKYDIEEEEEKRKKIEKKRKAQEKKKKAAAKKKKKTSSAKSKKKTTKKTTTKKKSKRGPGRPPKKKSTRKTRSSSNY